MALSRSTFRLSTEPRQHVARCDPAVAAQQRGLAGLHGEELEVLGRLHREGVPVEGDPGGSRGEKRVDDQYRDGDDHDRRHDGRQGPVSLHAG